MCSRFTVWVIIVGLFVAKLLVTHLYVCQYAFYKYFPSLAIFKRKNPIGKYQQVVWGQRKTGSTPSNKDRDDRPNVIIILADDLGANDLHDEMFSISKSIRSIAHDGVNFTQSYAGHATCAPSRASLLTGQFPTRFGFEFTPIHPTMARIFSWARHNSTERNVESVFNHHDASRIPRMAEMAVPTTVKFLPQLLRENGYRTLFVGKWHLGEHFGRRPLQKGFDESLTFLMGASQFLHESNTSGVTARLEASEYDEFLWRNLPFVVAFNDGQYFEPNEYMTEYLSKQAADAIISMKNSENAQSESCSRQPFFLEVAFNAPHNPFHALVSDYDSPELANIASHRLRVYAAMIRALDRGVQRILDAVESIGESNNTIVVFTSDNGGAEYAGLRNLNKPFRGWKATLFEGGLRVPMFMKWPAQIAPGTVVDLPVGHVDLFASIAAAASVPLHQYIRKMDGINFLPAIGMDAQSYSEFSGTCMMRWRSSAVNENHPRTLYWRSGHYKAIRLCDWKLHISQRPRKLWLFNLAIDPTEQHNLVHGINVTAALNWAERDCSFDQGTPANFVTTPENNDALCDLLRALFEVEAKQVPPIWPALSEVVMPIDHPINVDGMEGCGECLIDQDEEYIYWPI